MRKTVAFIVSFIILGLAFASNSLLGPKSERVLPIKSTPTPSIVKEQTGLGQTALSSLFVPYWSLGRTQYPLDYDRYYYFGITTTAEGLDTTESGYKNIRNFINLVPLGKEKYVVVRMTDSSINSSVLRSQSAQEHITQDSLTVVNQYGFDGVVLDFEINALAFDSVIKQINTFIDGFAQKAHGQNIPFYITLYGDNYYRLRPYDVKTLAAKVDGVLIMTYDLHKTSGDPGPNFPLAGKEQYGYDLDKLVQDFSKDIPKNKTTIVLGLFGYDWTVDSKNKSVDTAKAVTLNEANKRFIKNCLLKNCKVTQDNASKETKVTYVDESNQNHIVWFETMDSLMAKKEYLKSRGINSVSLWAYSYF